jgi:DNA-binding response OmpR family regulator
MAAKLKILLVEDTPELVEIVTRELLAAGHHVLHAGDGLAALALFERDKPDLVILDWMLPGIDGLSVLRRLRQTATTPVLMLTARDEETDIVLGLELGADDYLTKPFGMQELLARVRAMLRRTEIIAQTIAGDHQANQARLELDGLVIDPQAHLASLHGHPLDLTRTELLLLHLLGRHPGRAFSRDYLLDAVWGQHYVEGDRAVDNAVLRLRKKLGVMGDNIETVWGVGYRWRPPS